ncbi:hypothetical protein JXA40_12010 [bacterium]|nr:hypothetical protein [candidate division CSSED10-310 bacterium]
MVVRMQLPDSVHRILLILVAGTAMAINTGTVLLLMRPPESLAGNVRHRFTVPAGIPDFKSIFCPDKPPVSTDAGTMSPQSWISRKYGVELKGTVAGEMAVFRILESGREILLRPGDPLDNGTVSEISRNQVIIDGPEGRETLRLPSRSEIQPVDATSAGSHVLNRGELTSILTDIKRFAEEIAIQTVRGADGGLSGFRIAALKPGGLPERMGLKPGDVMVSVNSRTVQTPEDIYRVFEEAVHQNRLTLMIRRGNREVELGYAIQ